MWKSYGIHQLSENKVNVVQSFDTVWKHKNSIVIKIFYPCFFYVKIVYL